VQVIKGKKMPGHMGEDTITCEGLKVFKIDIKRGLLYIEGSVPGKPGTIVRVRDAPKKPFAPAAPPPFPTYHLSAEEQAQLDRWARGTHRAATMACYELRCAAWRARAVGLVAFT
jgi:hypothetical protein